MRSDASQQVIRAATRYVAETEANLAELIDRYGPTAELTSAAQAAQQTRDALLQIGIALDSRRG